MAEMSRDEIGNRFTYHAPAAEQVPKFQAIRAKAAELAQVVIESTPPSREQSIAMIRLDEVVMWANAAIARNSR